MLKYKVKSKKSRNVKNENLCADRTNRTNVSNAAVGVWEMKKK